MNSLFLGGEVLKAARRAAGGLLLWALALALVLAAGTALLLLPAGGKASGPVTEAVLLAGLSLDLSEAAINQLAWRIWAQPEVVQVNFRFPGEDEPVPVESRALVVKLSGPAARRAVEEELDSTPGITEVSYFERTIKPPPRLPLLARILALVGLVLATALALALGRYSVGRLARAWGNALELLRASGFPEVTLRVPFLLVGALVGLLGGAIYVALVWGALSWAADSLAVRELVPELPTCGPLATGLGLAVGLLLGTIGGLLGYPQRPHS